MFFLKWSWLVVKRLSFHGAHGQCKDILNFHTASSVTVTQEIKKWYSMYQQLLWNFKVIFMRRKWNCVKYHHAALFLYLVVYQGYHPAFIIRSKVQRKHVQRLIKPSLTGYRSKTGSMDKLEHDSQTSLQPLVLSVWGAVLSEQWGAMVSEMHWKF